MSQRCLISLPVADTWVPAVQQFQMDLKRRLCEQGVDADYYFRWIPAVSGHITLASVHGMTCLDMEDMAVNLRSFRADSLRLSLRMADCFKRNRGVSVIWLGVGGDDVGLHLFTTRLRRHLQLHTCYKQSEQAFLPHFSLARPCKPLPLDVSDKVCHVLASYSQHQELASALCFDKLHMMEGSMLASKQHYVRYASFVFSGGVSRPLVNRGEHVFSPETEPGRFFAPYTARA